MGKDIADELTEIGMNFVGPESPDLLPAYAVYTPIVWRGQSQGTNQLLRSPVLSSTGGMMMNLMVRRRH